MGKRLLWIQNRPDNVREIRQQLHSDKWDIKLLVCRDGQRAINYLFGRQASKKCPRLILLDYNVATVPARGLLWLIRRHEETRNVPVYVLADPESFREARNLMEAGATGILMKPVNYQQLLVVCVEWGLLHERSVQLRR